MASEDGTGQPAGRAAEFDDVPAAGRARGRLRTWAFRLIAMTVVPAAFFVLLEVSLRLFGYGYSTDYFIAVPGTAERMTNQKFAWRFFPPTGARAPVPARFAARKPAGLTRVFVFGGSAAMGSPEAAFSFARVLEVMLEELWPDRRFEVINTAMEGMDSHVARVIASQAAGLEGDLFLVYMGNNEVVGPYGVSDAFTSFTPSLPVIRASIWVKSTRIGQLLRDTLRGFGGREEIWKGMETFEGGHVTADDLRLPRTYDHFRRNLRAILAAGRSGGAATLLCTVATNLRENAPFLSVHRADLSPADKARWEAHYAAAKELAGKGQHKAAVERYLQAAAIDDRFAELHYLLAGSSLEDGQVERARTHFRLARDLDALRVRADSNINEVLRDLAGEADAFVDAEKAIAASDRSREGLPGHELFLDHVHCNFEGNYTLAAAVFPTAARLLAPRLGRKLGADPPIADRRTCRERIALTGWDRYRIARAMLRVTSLPPFTNQCDHARRIAEQRERIERLRPFSRHGAREATLAMYQAALKRRPTDLLLRISYAVCLFGFGDNAGAAEQWRILRDALPGHAEFEKQLGVAMLHQGAFAEAVAQFRKALDILPRDLNAWNNLGAALLWMDRSDEAVACFRRVLRANRDHEDARTNLAIAEARTGQTDQARQNFLTVLKRDPTHVEALRNLARLLTRENKVDEAIAQYRKALAAREEHAVHLDLGRLLAEQGRSDEALVHFRRAVEMSPHIPETHLALGHALLEKKDYPAAAECLATALRLDDRLAEAHAEMGVVLQRTGRLNEATQHYARAVSLNAGDWVTRERLAYALLLQRQWGECVKQYEQVLTVQPNRAEAHTNVGIALTKLARTGEAILHFAAAVKLEPNALRHYNLATQLVRHGQDREAVVHFQRALAARPAWPEAMGELAWVLATADDQRIRNGAEAVRLARRACQLAGKDRADLLDALAAALAEVGHFDEAAATAEKARDLARATGQSQMADRIAKRIDLYKARQPCRRGGREVQ